MHILFALVFITVMRAGAFSRGNFMLINFVSKKRIPLLFAQGARTHIHGTGVGLGLVHGQGVLRIAGGTSPPPGNVLYAPHICPHCASTARL